MAAIFGEGKIFLKLLRVQCSDTLWVENFDKIALSRTVKEIEADWCFAYCFAYFRNHSHHSFLLPNTGPPPWQRLGTCLMSHDLCLTDWMVCLRIR